MAKDKPSTNEQALTILKGMRENHQLGGLERWAIDYAIEFIETRASIRDDLSETERALRETELALTGEFEVFEEDESR